MYTSMNAETALSSGSIYMFYFFFSNPCTICAISLCSVQERPFLTTQNTYFIDAITESTSVCLNVTTFYISVNQFSILINEWSRNWRQKKKNEKNRLPSKSIVVLSPGQIRLHRTIISLFPPFLFSFAHF